MKRILSVIIASLMVILNAALALPSFAADTDTLNLSMTNAAGYQNEEITIELNINENPGFSYLVFLLYYDSDTFILRDTELTEEYSEYLELWDSKDNISSDELSGPIATRILSQLKDYNISASDKSYKLVILEPYKFNDITNTGTILKFKFQIMGIAKDGEYTIGILPSNEDIINAKDEDVNVSWSNANVRVGSEKAPEETQKTITYEDTVDASEITEDPGDTTSVVTDKDTSTETDKEPVSSDDTESGEGAKDTESDSEKESDVEVNSNPSNDKEVEVLGNKVPVLYIIIGALVILVIAAVILTAVFMKSKKNKQ